MADSFNSSGNSSLLQVELTSLRLSECNVLYPQCESIQPEFDQYLVLYIISASQQQFQPWNN
jgi:hypothetical protein